MNVLYQAMAAEPGTASVVEGNRITHCLIGTPYQDTFSSRDLVVRNNYYHDVAIGPYENRFAISRYLDGIALATLTPVSPGSNTAEATTNLAHGLIKNVDFVTISGDTSSDKDKYNTAPGAQPFTITAVPGPNKFQYAANGPLNVAALQASYQLPDLLRPLRSLVRQQGNAMSITGIMEAIGGSQEHGLEKGDVINIIHAAQWDTTSLSFIRNSEYNSKWTIDSVDTNGGVPQFHFTVDADPGFDADGTINSAGFFGRIWQLKRLTIENNVIELAVRKPSVRSSGIFMYCSRDYTPYSLLRQIVVRSNVIRYMDNAADPAQISTGIELQYVQNALVQDNIVRMTLNTAIQYLDPATGTGVRTFNNWTPAGLTIQAVRQIDGSVADGSKAPDVGTQFRQDLDAMVLGLF